ncbi:release factor glutamine methyltransferase [Actinopolyspora xinjiangensis]|uniref:peptide chain release factor N(5)-glutamine methyltransferase n=1 Tax=Actinopolyspora xinjiangensis TaxID=405564 RepID=A0A1H0NEG3_9ACTN|nr:putative protein N(5)-glutamine methyltransferase [Actinopolyspora xinjiangensis]SDO91149.1 release factor glutamine methyltransferase [Actinopolyspora xinjiangensis]
MTSQGDSRSLTDTVAELRTAGCVFAEREAELLLAAAPTDAELREMTRRRVDGTPLEVVLGWAEFLGARYVVEPGVFVPRRRSEFLARQALSLVRPGDVVVELCCGSAAIAAAVAGAAERIEPHACDIDPDCVRCARRNLAELGGTVHRGDLYEALPEALRGRVELLVANAPYVPTGAIASMPPEAREHEPRVALDGGADGLDVQRRIAAGALRWLSPGGHLLLETGERQADRSVAVCAEHGLRARVVRSEEDDATVVVATPAGA